MSRAMPPTAVECRRDMVMIRNVPWSWSGSKPEYWPSLSLNWDKRLDNFRRRFKSPSCHSFLEHSGNSKLSSSTPRFNSYASNKIGLVGQLEIRCEEYRLYSAVSAEFLWTIYLSTWYKGISVADAKSWCLCYVFIVQQISGRIK